MGCIIVSEPVLDSIERTYVLNHDSLDVKTVEHMPTLPLEIATLIEKNDLP
jgi:hypothetical protein